MPSASQSCSAVPVPDACSSISRTALLAAIKLDGFNLTMIQILPGTATYVIVRIVVEMKCTPPLTIEVNKDVFTTPSRTGIRLTLMLDLAVALIVLNLD